MKKVFMPTAVLLGLSLIQGLSRAPEVRAEIVGEEVVREGEVATAAAGAEDVEAPDCSKAYTFLDCAYRDVKLDLPRAVVSLEIQTVTSITPYAEGQSDLNADGAQWMCYLLAQRHALKRLDESYPGGVDGLLRALQDRSDAGTLSAVQSNALSMLKLGFAPVADVTVLNHVLGEHPDCIKKPHALLNGAK